MQVVISHLCRPARNRSIQQLLFYIYSTTQGSRNSEALLLFQPGEAGDNPTCIHCDRRIPIWWRVLLPTQKHPTGIRRGHQNTCMFAVKTHNIHLGNMKQLIKAKASKVRTSHNSPISTFVFMVVVHINQMIRSVTKSKREQNLNLIKPD